jgi:glycosyltransferase involved in cell wall biosynthesis
MENNNAIDMLLNGKQVPVLMLSVSRWDQELSSASISMAKELSRDTRVFYIDHPFSVKDIFTGFKSSKVRRRLRALFFGKRVYAQVDLDNRNLIAVTPLVTLPINWLPPGKLYAFFSKINNWIFCRVIRRIIRDHNLDSFVYWNSYNPFFSYELPSDIKPALYIYQSRDNIAESNYVKRHGPQLELKASNFADIRLATSTDLAERLSQLGKKFILFPNAAEVDIFKRALEPIEPVPEELQSLAGNKRIIGYIGNICLRQDYELLRKIAVAFPNDILLMVGPRNDRPYHSINFDEFPNIVFTGPKKLHDLPRYLSYMDVVILPFLVNDLTRSIYPLKLHEYLAAGKPVVSTKFSVDVERFSEIIYIAKTHDDFVGKINVAFNEHSEQQKASRIGVAKLNSWKLRKKQLEELLNK